MFCAAQCAVQLARYYVLSWPFIPNAVCLCLAYARQCGWRPHGLGPSRSCTPQPCGGGGCGGGGGDAAAAAVSGMAGCGPAVASGGAGSIVHGSAGGVCDAATNNNNNDDDDKPGVGAAAAAVGCGAGLRRSARRQSARACSALEVFDATDIVVAATRSGATSSTLVPPAAPAAAAAAVSSLPDDMIQMFNNVEEGRLAAVSLVMHASQAVSGANSLAFSHTPPNTAHD